MTIAIDSEQKDKNATQWSHTCSGSDRMLVVAISVFAIAEANSRITSVDYGGVSLTKGIESDGDGDAKQSIWYLASPATGTDNINVYKSNASFALRCSSVSFTGATSTIGASSKSKGTSSSVSTVVAASNSSGYVVDAGYAKGGVGAPGAGGGQTVLHSGYSGNERYSSYKSFASSGNVTMSWSLGASMYWETVALEIGGIAASGPANLKTWDGVAKASIKTYNGVAIASIKTLDGVA